MPEIISCPKCLRKLQVHTENLGQEVRCPSCTTNFVAQLPVVLEEAQPQPIFELNHANVQRILENVYPQWANRRPTPTSQESRGGSKPAGTRLSRFKIVGCLGLVVLGFALFQLFFYFVAHSGDGQESQADKARKAFQMAKSTQTATSNAWNRKNYQGVIDVINDDRVQLLERTPIPDVNASFLIRSYIRLDKPKEALREAEGLSDKVEAKPWLILVATAATGDVPKTLSLLDQFARRENLAVRMYGDEDFGPILRSEPFREVRDKYPEPK